MSTLAVPKEFVFVLVLLPGFLATRSILYFARRAGPANWPEYEKTAWSLVGSIVLIAGFSVVFPRLLTIDQRETSTVIATQLTARDYVIVLAVAVVAGAVLGQGFVVVYKTLYGLTPMRKDPLQYLVEGLRTPMPVRVVTDHDIITGRAKYTDMDSNLVVLSSPRRVLTENGKERRESLGEYVYIDPADINEIYFGSTFKSDSWKDAVARILEIPLPTESEPEVMVTVDKEPLHREADCARAVGTLKNETSRKLMFVQATVRFKSGNVQLGTGFDSGGKISPGERWRFEVEFETDDPNAVDDYKVMWNAAYY